MGAMVVRTLKLAAIVAFVECFNFQRIVRPAIAAAMGRYFSLWDSHGYANSSNKTVSLRLMTLNLESRP